MLMELEKLNELAGKATNRLAESLKLANELETRLKGNEYKNALDKTKAVKDSINVLMDAFLGKKDERQGLLFEYITPASRITTAQYYIRSSRGPINDTDMRMKKQAEDKIMQVIDRVNRFYKTEWADYRASIEKLSLPLFKNYEPLIKP
jgi:hypothetical protein